MIVREMGDHDGPKNAPAGGAITVIAGCSDPIRLLLVQIGAPGAEYPNKASAGPYLQGSKTRRPCSNHRKKQGTVDQN